MTSEILYLAPVVTDLHNSIIRGWNVYVKGPLSSSHTSHIAYRHSNVFSTPDLVRQAYKWNWSVIQPILGISLPSWDYSKTNDSKRRGRDDKKELAQAARRQYLKDLGGYDLSAVPSPTPSGNKIGNCAESLERRITLSIRATCFDVTEIPGGVQHFLQMPLVILCQRVRALE